MENTNTTPTPTHTDTNDNITTLGNVVISVFIIAVLLLIVIDLRAAFPSHQKYIVPVATAIFYTLFGNPKFLRKKKNVKDAQTNSSDTHPQNTEKKE